jgi:hypothetical protein
VNGERRREWPLLVRTSGPGILFFILGLAIVQVLSLIGAKSLLAGPPLTSGISVFAIQYIDAQLIERLVEPLSEISITNWNLFGNTQDIKDKKSRISGYQEQIRVLVASQVTTSTHAMSAQIKDLEGVKDIDSKALDPQATRRMVSFWGFNSLLGMVLVYYTVGFFATLGNPLRTISMLGMTVTGPALDAMISGVIVGGGTKPLHDLIKTLEKSKD